jgi:aerobic C4-dicarboxylate transport protein
LVLAVSSSEIAIPILMAKLEKLGSMVGLIVPTGFAFNTDGTSLYMTMATPFVAQATKTHLTLAQQLTILAVAVLTSKGASAVQGASFVALVATLSVIPSIPVAGMALILGIDRFLSMFRALVNMIGNGVAFNRSRFEVLPSAILKSRHLVLLPSAQEPELACGFKRSLRSSFLL